MTVTVKVSGETYNAANNYTIKLQSGAISISDIDILVGSTQEIPRAMESVEILFDSVAQFYGYIESVDSPQFNGGKEAKRYRITVQSAEVVFKWRMVSESFVGKFTHEIIQSIFTDYIAPEGFTLGAISNTDRYYEEYNVSYMSVYQILQELSDDINAAFYITPDKKFYFVGSDAFTEIPMPEHTTGLKLTETGSDVRTVQIVTGATEETTDQTATATWIANQKTLLLGYQASAVISATINGSPVGVGVLGLEEEDTSKTFLWSYGSNTITVNDNATTKPVTGNTVAINYRGYYNIIVSNENDQLKSELATMSGTSGRIESVYNDETINNFADADSAANTLLEQYGEREQTVSAVCHSLADTDRGIAWIIERDDLGINGIYVITERTISYFGVDKVLIKVKLKNRGYFSRYGRSLKKFDKLVRPDTIVYKQTQLIDTATATEQLTFDNGGVIFYPVAVGSDLTDPALDGFYPIGE